MKTVGVDVLLWLYAMKHNARLLISHDIYVRESLAQ